MTEADRLQTALALLENDTVGANCPSRKILDQVTSRWGTLVLAALVAGPHRFSALRARVAGISEKMLSQTLKQLVRAGLVDRDVRPTVPPQVTYSLTALGSDLAVPLCHLVSWLGQHTDELLAAQRAYDDAHA
ncbi:helix-turn-helix domain-containing protein [Streptomyces parvulus]|uniref:Transcriptional regulator n=1 Tax=Streptomyces parvulus TaxID=146923 RepID=A0A369UXZ9_9ACTN|nr:helix-turn-helix domain-containing protein [Streptomyces parvulus]RDD85153.1 transcriptional regulator [Streptomyces parvulus]